MQTFNAWMIVILLFGGFMFVQWIRFRLRVIRSAYFMVERGKVMKKLRGGR